MFDLKDSGLFYTPTADSQPKFLCGPIKVIAITRGTDEKSDFGLLVEWKNMDGKLIKHLFQRRQIINDNGRFIKDFLVDSGLDISSWQGVWSHIFNYLNQSKTNTRLFSSKKTGWINKSFVTPSWSVNSGSTPIIYSGNSNENFLSSNGTVSGWQREVGSLCINNPVLALSICCGLSAPLLHWLNWPSNGVHLYGKSKISKTTIVVIAASLYSGTDFYYTWRATDNGLEATAVEHNDMLVCLDELHQAMPEVVDQTIYTLANGVSKIRSNKTLSRDEKKTWRLIFLSSGEMGLEEKLAPLKKEVKAGQEIRFLEVPVLRKYGPYDDLYGHKSINDFSEHIWKVIKNNHGTIMPKWIEYLASIDDLPSLLNKRIRDLREEWINDDANKHGNQVLEALKRFALLGVAGELGVSAGLMPWPQGLAEKSAKMAFDGWLEMRGTSNDSEDEKIIKQLPNALTRWRRKLVPEGTILNDNYGYVFGTGEEQVWLLTRPAFQEGLGLTYKHQIAQAVKFMEDKAWMETSEGRATFKKIVEGGPKGGRYYKVLPHRITEELALDKVLSQAALTSQHTEY